MLNGRCDRAISIITSRRACAGQLCAKLALADVLAASSCCRVRRCAPGSARSGCFLKTTPPPEIISTHIVSGKHGDSAGRAVAREKRAALPADPVAHGLRERKFDLRASGQELIHLCRAGIRGTSQDSEPPAAADTYRDLS